MHYYISLATYIKCVTKYGSTLHIGMDEGFQHHAHTFEKSSTYNVSSVLLPQNGSFGQHTCVPTNCITNNRNIVHVPNSSASCCCCLV